MIRTRYASPSISTAIRCFASTARPINVEPLAQNKDSRKDSPLVGASEVSVATATTAGTELSEVKAHLKAAVRIQSMRVSADPYLPNAQRELPPYVSKEDTHPSSLTPDEAMAFHAQQSHHNSHRASAEDMMSRAARPSSAATVSHQIPIGLTSEVGTEFSVHKSLYERPGLHRDMLVSQREDRKVNLRQVQLQEALGAQAEDASSEGGRAAAVIAKRTTASGEEELIPNNSSPHAPGRATRAELAEQAVLNAMRMEDIDRLNRDTYAEAAPTPGDGESYLREVLRSSGRAHMATAERARKDVFGEGLDDRHLRFRSGTGVGSGDPAMPIFKIDPLQRKRLLAERQDAVLGVGPLGIREARKKATLAEQEYELSLLPQERKVYKEEKARVTTQLLELEAEHKKEEEDSAAKGQGDPSSQLSAFKANTQYPILRAEPKLFQTRDINRDEVDALISYDPVPNNAPVPKAPMWTSSLSIPTRGRRFLEDNWRNPQLSKGILSEEKINNLRSFLSKACPQLVKDRVFEDNVVMQPRAMYTKGLYAKRRFKKGEIIATVPIPRTWPEGTAPSNKTAAPSSWMLSLTTESLLVNSKAVKDREVPSYESLHHMLAKPTTSMGVAAHPLFTEQIYLACLIACEKDLGEASALAPLFGSIDDLVIDDDYVKEIHRQAIEAHSYYELDDHIRRYDNALRMVQKRWPMAPHFDTLKWALRFVFSRQRMVPVRTTAIDSDKINDVWDSKNDNKDLDWFALGVRKVREMLFRATVPKAMIRSAEKVSFETDKAVMPSVVGLVDMLHHDNKGIGTVVMEHCKGGQVVDRSPSYGSEADGQSLAPPTTSDASSTAASSSSASVLDKHDDVSIVIRANHDLEAGEELTVVYPKCYSVSYTLYKYGFLAYRKPDQDAGLYYKQHGAMELSKNATHSHEEGTDDYPDPIGEPTMVTLQKTYAQEVTINTP